VFKATPEVYNSSVSITTGFSRVRYLNSDGTSYAIARPSASVSVQAFTQAADGMPLADYFSASGQLTSDLPSRDTLLAQARALSARLVKLRATPLAQAYDGPVLFEGDAAGELLNTILAPKLVAARRPVTSPVYERMVQMQSGANDWLDLIGARVLPSFLNVVDDPTLSSVQGVKLFDSYRVDDEGVSARPTKVIERGILKTLLMTRVPVSGIEHSTGNRRGNGAAPTHLVVSADSGLAADELRRTLLALASAQGRDYAIIVRRLTNPRMTLQMDPSAMSMFMSSGGSAAEPSMRALVAVKVYTDGREEAVRGADITGVGATALKSIIAVSKTQTVYSTTYFSAGGFLAGGGGSGRVTYVTPALLLDNVSIRKPKGNNPRPPVVAPPF
jgi:TldD protein